VWGSKKHPGRSVETVFSYFEARLIARLQIEMIDDEMLFRKRWGSLVRIERARIVLKRCEIEE
jgi:hypothetical protein